VEDFEYHKSVHLEDFETQFNDGDGELGEDFEYHKSMHKDFETQFDDGELGENFEYHKSVHMEDSWGRILSTKSLCIWRILKHSLMMGSWWRILSTISLCFYPPYA